MLVLQGKPGTDSWVADRYGRVLEQCAQAVLGSGARVVFAGDPAAAAHDALSHAGHGRRKPPVRASASTLATPSTSS